MSTSMKEDSIITDEPKENKPDSISLNTSIPSISPVDITSPRIVNANSTGHFMSLDEATSLQTSGNADDINKLKNKIFYYDAEKFNLRIGPNYSSKKLKAPAGKALLELVGCDMYTSASRIDNIGSQIRFPDAWTNLDTDIEGVPPLFVVNCQLPSDCSLATVLANVFTDITNGPGYSCVLYYRLSEATIEAMKDMSSTSPALQLYVNYCREAPELDSDPKSKYKGRFKAMCNCNNIDDFGLPNIIKGYNSKPVLIRNSGKLFRGEKYIEMDVNLHSFGSIFRKGLGEVLPIYERMVLGMGFCIESRDDEEMPELLFGTATFHQPLLSSCISWDGTLAPWSPVKAATSS